MIVGVYAVGAAAWIVLSDGLTGAFVPRADTLVEINHLKSFAFVAVTAGLLYLLLRRTSATVDRLFTEVECKEAERSLHEAEQRRADAIIESTDDAIIGRTLDGKITTWNPAAERLFGYDAKEIVGHPITELIPSGQDEEKAVIGQCVAAAEGVRHFETTRQRKDGARVPVSITFSPIVRAADAISAGATIEGVSEIVREITDRRRVEALAEREQEFASSLLEATPGVLYLYDERGRFLRWNRNFERVSGYSAEEIAAMHPLDFFGEGDKETIGARIADVFENGESSTEAMFVAKNGNAVPYFFTGRLTVFDGSRCLIGVGVDISSRKRAEEALRKSEERYRSTLESSLEGCQLLDFDWRYLYLNDAAAQQNRRPNHELLGQRMPDAWPGIEASAVFAMLKNCMDNRVAVHRETEFEFPDGHSGWFDVRAQPVPEGIFVLSIDITERKRAENALRELNQGLERKVAERTRDLDLAKDRAEAADRLKSAFLASMSHELRTPLNSIIGFTGIILQGMAGPLTAEQTKQLGMVQGSARHLLALINDVLDISKIEAGQVEIRVAPFDLRASFEHVAAIVGPHADKKGLSVRLHLPPSEVQVVSDQRRVEQILLNLLNNAIKFTDRGGVTVTLEMADEADPAGVARHVARFKVADTGIGMKEEDLGQLFQPFRQIDSGLQRQHEGTGLGLAICRRLTEMLGGVIRVDTKWGDGSVFTVVIPTTSASA